MPWLLGSSAQSAIWAGDIGLPYAFADFINNEGVEIAALYRDRFTAVAPAGRRGRPPSPGGRSRPTGDEEAERLAASHPERGSALLRQGRLIPVPPPDKAVRFLETQGASAGPRRRSIVGTPETVRAGLIDVAAQYGAEEVIVVTITHDHEARRRSYELIAEAFGLEAGPAPAGAATLA